MYVIIAGCGRVGSRLAESLSYEGHDVVVIDRDPASFRRLGRTFNGLTITGVAFDEELLGEAGIRMADVFVAVTNYDNTNLMAAEIATRIYRVPLVIARMYNPDKRETFRRLGVDYVCGTTMVAERIRDRILQGRVRFLLEDPDRDMWLVELDVGPELAGKRTEDILAKDEGRVLAVYREGKTFLNSSGLLREGDMMVLALGMRGLHLVEELERSRVDAGVKPESHQNHKLPSAKSKGLKVVIAGCGRVGAQLAEMLSLDGHQVTILDRDRESFRRLSKAFIGDAVEGDAYDDEILVRVGIKKADAFAAVTNYDNTNLMAAEVVKHIFKVPRVVARMYNPDKEETFRALNVDFVCGTEVVARAILDKIYTPILREIGACCNNALRIYRLKVPARWEGKDQLKISEDYGITVAFVVRGDRGILGDEGLRLREGDVLVFLVPEEESAKLERKVRAKEVFLTKRLALKGKR